jgi:uncharacterized protein
VNLAELSAVLFAASIAAGTLGAMLGLGGGFIVVPLLTLAFHADIRIAIGSSIIAVVATSSAGGARNVGAGMTNLRVAAFLATATTVGAATGAWLAGIAPSRTLYICFAVILCASASQMLLRARAERKLGRHELVPAAIGAFTAAWEGDPEAAPGGDGHGGDGPGGPSERPPAQSRLADSLRLHSMYFDQATQRDVPYRVAHAGIGLCLMYVAGVVSGLLGIGSGVLKVPAMDLVMHLPMKVSTATSNILIGITGAASALVWFLRGDVDPQVAGVVALGVLCGASGGARLLPRMRSERLRIVFVVVVGLIALEMLWRGVT